MNTPHLTPEGWRYESQHRMNKALPGWDYRKPWIYMITMAVTGRRRILGRLVGEMGTTKSVGGTAQDQTEGTATQPQHAAPGSCPVSAAASSGTPASSPAPSGVSGLGPVFGGATTRQDRRLPMNSPLRAGSNIVATTRAWVELSPLGKRVEQCIRSIETFHPEIRVLKLTIMEDHVHFILHVQKRLPKPLGTVIGSIPQFGISGSNYLRLLTKLIA